MMINNVGNEKKTNSYYTNCDFLWLFANYWTPSQFKGFSFLTLKLIPENLRGENPLCWKCQQ